MVNPTGMQRRVFLSALVPALFWESGCQQTMNSKELSGADIEGKGWTETRAPFDRLPAAAERTVPPSVWSLSHHSAGLCYRFVTTAPQLEIRWAVGGELAMPHMPATGVSGVDLYSRSRSGQWRFVGTGFPRQPIGNQVSLPGTPPGETPDGKPREFRLYLPLYNSTTRLEVSVPAGNTLSPAPAYVGKSLVFYGTSITQGGCASRPGMAFPAIVARTLEREHINLGFSGSGKMEPALGDLLAELDPAVFVLDCLRNMSEAQVAERMEPFLHRLHERRPETPILCLGDAFLDNPKTTSRGALTQAAVEKLTRAGLKNLHFFSGRGAWGDDGEGTVDGVHPNDLGMSRQAAHVVRALKPFIK